VDVRDRNGETPLHIAVKASRVNVAALLIQHGASVNVSNVEGWTPLHHASNELIVTLLLKHGADASARGPSGLLPIEYKKDAACKKVLADAGSIVPVVVRRASMISTAPSQASKDTPSGDAKSVTPTTGSSRPVSTVSEGVATDNKGNEQSSTGVATADVSGTAAAPAVKKKAPPPPPTKKPSANTLPATAPIQTPTVQSNARVDSAVLGAIPASPESEGGSVAASLRPQSFASNPFASDAPSDDEDSGSTDSGGVANAADKLHMFNPFAS
jgi:hypothetical protein